MKFDVVLTNPPFQDRHSRGRTPHKLWIEFTTATFDRLLRPGGLLLQITPTSFQSPSSKVLRLMCTLDTQLINFDIAQHFPGVGSSFAYYAIRHRPHAAATTVTIDGATFQFDLDDSVRWLPSDLSESSLSIHRKTMWSGRPLLPVEHDYITHHNIRLGDTLSKTPTPTHVYPVFHTNAQTWYGSVRQPFADRVKIMWTRSGYTKPFLDLGQLGGSDMVYYIVVKSRAAGRNLLHNLTLPLMRYIFATARWSGFGNEIVFHSLPALPTDRALSAAELYDVFGLTDQERHYVEQYLG